VPPARRPRKQVSPVVIKLLSPFFRYSTTRDAYVLRLGGEKRGPVLRDSPEPPPPQR
jgi:hypothetical protein